MCFKIEVEEIWAQNWSWSLNFRRQLGEIWAWIKGANSFANALDSWEWAKSWSSVRIFYYIYKSNSWVFKVWQISNTLCKRMIPIKIHSSQSRNSHLPCLPRNSSPLYYNPNKKGKERFLGSKIKSLKARSNVLQNKQKVGQCWMFLKTSAYFLCTFSGVLFWGTVESGTACDSNNEVQN